MLHDGGLLNSEVRETRVETLRFGLLLNKNYNDSPPS